MRAIAFVLLVAACACGCSTWRSQGLTPEAVVAREQPERLRVVSAAGGEVELDRPRVEGDSLVGTVEGVRTAVALRGVTRVEVKRKNPTGERIITPLLVSFGLMVAALASWQ